MTEYIVKEIGHQWIAYADRRSIAGCADEASALKLIAEHSAANKATCKATQTKTHQREPAGDTSTIERRCELPTRDQSSLK
jgi:hypothetical protein